MLESAVVLGWSDLSQAQESHSMQMEYGFGAEGTIDFLKLWRSSDRGHWHLVCQYDLQTQNLVRFEKGYASAGLRRNLEFIMQHQSDFLPLHNYGREGLLQIQEPTQEQVDAAQTELAVHLKLDPPGHQNRS
jgi:hypothetical protein